MKSTVEEIRQRFDNEVERFTNLESGQNSIIDAGLGLELVTQAAASVCPHATHLLDVGCGAGNFTLKLLPLLPNLDITLVDLSARMLERAVERIQPIARRTVNAMQADIRELELGNGQYDIIIAAAVLHHLRAESEWEALFSKIFTALRAPGSFWIFDLIESSSPPIQALTWKRYGDYLTQLRDVTYRDYVFNYIEKEDTPRSLVFQIDLLRKVGFPTVEILHKNGCFAAFGALKEFHLTTG